MICTLYFSWLCWIYASSPSSSFLRMLRRRLGFSSLTSALTPASSGSMRIRPQYSHTITFLRIRTSNWRCGGILAKQPPHASRCTYTIPSPLRLFLRIRLKAVSKRGSIEISRFLAFSRSFSSSAFVSATISSSSFFFTSRSWLLSSRVALLRSISSSLNALVAKFYFQCLELDFFVQEVVLTVVAHIVKL